LTAYVSECLGEATHAVPFYKQAESAFAASAHTLGKETPDVVAAMLRFCRMRLRALQELRRVTEGGRVDRDSGAFDSKAGEMVANPIPFQTSGPVR
jgi:hypothetical protein